MEWHDIDKCPAHCPCWAHGHLTEPVTEAEADVQRSVEKYASRIRGWGWDDSLWHSWEGLIDLVKEVAAGVARGDMDKRRMAIVLSGSYPTSVLGMCLPSRKTTGSNKFPHGVPELIQLGVCLKTGLRFWSQSALEWVLGDILSLRKHQSRKQSLRCSPLLNMLVDTLRKDPVHLYCTVAKLPRHQRDAVRAVCQWVPRGTDVMALVGATKRWERRSARRAWVFLVVLKK